MRVFFIALLCLMSIASYADDRKENEASRIARSFFGGAEVELVNAACGVKSMVNSTHGATPAYYIYNKVNEPGFVIVGGSSFAPEIVGYSFESAFDVGNMSPALGEFLQSFERTVELADSLGCNMRSLIAAKTAPAVDPIVSALWGQGAPYDKYCPEIDGEKCPVGCVATALSQVMYHYKWPKEAKGKVTYTPSHPSLGKISHSFAGHVYDWDSMRNTTEENLASSESSEAVAYLSYECGIACKMDYGVNGSGTFPDIAMKALYANFGYKASSLSFHRRNCYESQEEWNELLMSELSSGRPVMYSAVSPAAGGHEFLIDGYDSDGKFHVNWGWDGMNNGYFNIVNLCPGPGMAFTESHTMVCGICPDYEGTDITPAQWQIYMAMQPSVQEAYVNLGSEFEFVENYVYNPLSTKSVWTFGVGLYDLDENLLNIITDVETDENESMLAAGYGYSEVGITATLPASLKDGYYILKAVFKQYGYDDFVTPAMAGGNHLNRVYVQVKDGVAYFNQVPAGIDGCRNESVNIDSSFFDINGRKLASPTKGTIYIKKVTLPDGKMQMVKTISK